MFGVSVCLDPDYHLRRHRSSNRLCIYPGLVRLEPREGPSLVYGIGKSTGSSKPAAKTMYDNTSKTRTSVAILLHAIYGIEPIVVTANVMFW